MMKKRSRAYPFIDLQTAVGLLSPALRTAAHDWVARKLLGQPLGYRSGSGGNAARKIAALVQYGFLKRQTGHYRLTSLARRLVQCEPHDQQRIEYLQRAFTNPPIFREILAGVRDEGRVATNLDVLLTQKHGITDAASRRVADVFRRSGEFAKVLHPDGTLAKPLQLEDEPAAADGKPSSSTATFPFENFPLSKGKKASSAFEVPTSMSSTDFELLEEWVLFQLKSLRAHLGVEDPAPPNDDKKGSVAEFKRRLRKSDR